MLNDIELEVYFLLAEGITIKKVIEKISKKSNCNQHASSIVKRFLAQSEAKQFNKTVGTVFADSFGMYVFLTFDCNLKCSHCFLYDKPRLGDPLEIEQWKRILIDFQLAGGEKITLSGGEPTLFDSFADILVFAHGIGLKVTLLTNGMILHSELLELYSNNVDELQISLDGPEEISHEMIRGKGTYFKTYSNIKKALDKGVMVTIAMTPTFETFPFFEEHFVRFAKSLLNEYSNVNVKLTQKLLRSKMSIYSDTDMNKYYAKGNRLINNLYEDYSINAFYLDHPVNTIRRNCGYGEISVIPDGTVYLCSRICDLKPVANLKELKMVNVIQIAREEKERASVENIIPCQHCCLRYICSGGCRIDDIPDFCNGQLTVDCPEERKQQIFDMMIESNNMYFNIEYKPNNE